jgi:hypothetical protein
MTLKTAVTKLIERGEHLFSKRSGWVSALQDIAEQFYPERADFTTQRYGSSMFDTTGLMTSVPALIRRDLGNTLSAMLRPRGQEWFRIRTSDDDINEDPSAKKWLDWATDRQRKVIYDKRARFVRATKEGDHDFATFGQCVLSIDVNDERDGLLYRTWHLRDCAWMENASLEIDTVFRKWKPQARNLITLFPKTVDAKVKELADKEPFKEVKCFHIVLPSEEWSLSDEKWKGRKDFPYVSLYIDCDNQTVLEEVPRRRLGYIIPRWQTVSGSQYAHGPAYVAIADARLLQQMTLTLLEAGQKSVDPPMIAVGEMIQGGVNTYAGGVTWVDADYDERLGEVLRPMTVDKTGLNWGTEQAMRVEQILSRAFYLDQIRMPQFGEVRSATEMRMVYEQWVRSALPLFEPMETEYNSAVCDETFQLALENGAFGSPMDIPPMLRGQEIRFEFDSPLQSSVKRANAQAFLESAQLLATAAQLDPNAVHVFNTRQAVRDALDGAGASSDWMNTEEEAAAITDAAQQAQQEEMMTSQVAQGAEIANQVGQAGQSLAAAGMV